MLMKIGDRVSTEDGEGVIVDVEVYSRQGNRYGVKLDKLPEKLRLADLKFIWYWEKEIKKV